MSVKSRLSSIVHSTLNRFGLEVRSLNNLRDLREQEQARAELEPWQFLRHWNVRTVLDIGANTGQFATLIHKVLPDASIHSFEPLSECFQELIVTLKDIPGSRAHHLALSDESGTAAMIRNSFSPSSSLLKMTDLHRQEWPESSDLEPEIVELKTLDEVFAGQPLNDELLVKIDVQGFELQVICGGRKVIRQARAVVAEVCFQSFYKQQASFDKIFGVLRELDFSYAGQIEQFCSKATGDPMFADILFVNDSFAADKASGKALSTTPR